MYLAEIWRYPVKSLKGERLPLARIGTSGIEGDRAVRVEDARGRTITSRTRPRLLGLHGTTRTDGVALVNGRPWTDAAAVEEVSAAIGSKARLVLEPGAGFDILPLLVATDGAIAALGEDSRRLRPNLIIGGVEGLAERGWEGKRLRIGPVLIQAVDLRGRCIMTTFHPDTGKQDLNVLRRIQREFDGTMALNCAVLQAGVVKEGDAVEIVEDAIG
jgi:uncharacterized protein YcbX